MQSERHNTAFFETNAHSAPTASAAFERHYSVAELAKLWLFSPSTVRRIFINEPGVLKLVHEETRYKRGYTSLRIPEHIAKRVHRRLEGAASGNSPSAANVRRPVASAAVRKHAEISA